MAGYSQTIERLMAELGKLPGIGARTAERLAFHLLKAPDAEALALAEAIHDVKTKIRPCSRCFNLAEDELCAICSDARRDTTVIAVVEQPKDLLSLESTGAFRGLYHVLMGHIAPLEGTEAEDLTIDALVARVRQTATAEPGTGNSGESSAIEQTVSPNSAVSAVRPERITEVILATNPTVAGDATALYITSLLEPLGVKITRLARGLPAGGQIEYANKSILTDAINERR